MAVLPDADRAAVAAEFNRGYDTTEAANLAKPDIRAAINAVDDWFDLNAATVNLIFPQPFRANATVRQKARLLQYVLQKRYVRT